jgi:DNA-binding GntR family transcriptional regulator
MGDVVEHHRGIVQAIEKKDANGAESLRRAISENGRRLIQHYFIGHSNKDRKREVGA